MEWSMTVTTNPDAHYVLKTCELKVYKNKWLLRTYNKNKTKRKTKNMSHSHPPGLALAIILLMLLLLLFHGNWKSPPTPCPSAPWGGLMETQSKESVMAMRPDHTKTIVGVLPLLPINPFANGYKWASTQKLKNAPPINLLHCGLAL